MSKSMKDDIRKKFIKLMRDENMQLTLNQEKRICNFAIKQLQEQKQKYADREKVVEEKVRPFVIMKEEMMSRKDKHYNQVTISWKVLFDLVELIESIKEPKQKQEVKG